MAVTNRVTWEKIRSFDTSTVASSAVWYPVGIPLLFPSYKLKMVNASNVLLLVSIDGVNAFDVCPANSYWLYDEMQAPFSTASNPAVPQGTQIFVNQPAGTAGVGLVYLVSQYVVAA